MIEKLVKVQSELKAPKSQRNNFGKYNYRNCEDILEAVKPLLNKYGLLLTISDEVKENPLGIFVEATATVTDGEKKFMVAAQAGIDINRKGMDIAQSYGSSSSYARKYALNGLFLIDDTKDSDATNTHGKTAVNTSSDDLSWLPDSGVKFDNAKAALGTGKVSIQDIRKKYKVSKKVEQLLTA